MKMYLISDNVDTYTGMRLAGVDGIVIHEREELRTALEDVLADKTVGIVLLTEKLGWEFPDLIDTFRLERKMPLLVEIPRPSRNRAKKRFHHFLYHRSHWLKNFSYGRYPYNINKYRRGIPLDIRRKDHAFKDDFHGAGPG